LKLHLDRPGGTNFITAFEPDHVQVNQTRYGASLVVLRDRVLPDWPPRSADQLVAAHFESLAELGADIVLLGTGRSLKFPHPRLSAALMARRIGLEVMDSGAACRTYNILAGEGRNVAAALILE
jgi:uncharacterized protein